MKMASHGRNMGQILPNGKYCTLLDVCCVFTVHNILNKFDCTQRDGLSLKKKNLRTVDDNTCHHVPHYVISYTVLLLPPLGPNIRLGSLFLYTMNLYKYS